MSRRSSAAVCTIGLGWCIAVSSARPPETGRSDRTHIRSGSALVGGEFAGSDSNATTNWACCLPRTSCVDAAGKLGDSCESDDDCPMGSACAGCVERTEAACDAIDGHSLAPSNLPEDEDPVVSCELARCDRGACCVGPGKCLDSAGIPPCSAEHPDGCIDRETCDALLGAFVGGARCTFPSNPCPLCEFESFDNCQVNWSAGGISWSKADLDAFSGLELAEDFVPLASPISRVCVQGVYSDVRGDWDTLDCAETIGDDFQVCVYANDPETNLPDEMSGVCRAATVSSRAREIATSNGDLFIHRVQLELDVPITVTPGACHWIEVVNNTRRNADGTEGNTCHWYWATIGEEGVERDANTYSAWRYGGLEWLPASVDLAFCLDVPFESGGCGDRLGACCVCPGETKDGGDLLCSVQMMADCDGLDAGASYLNGEPDCTGVTCEQGLGPPLGDRCDDAAFDAATGLCAGLGVCVGDRGGAVCTGPVDCGPNGGCACDNGMILVETPKGGGTTIVPINNNCADTDGPPTLVALEWGPAEIEADLWYRYAASCTGRLAIHTCGTVAGYGAGGGWDSWVFIHHDPDDPGKCPCPENDFHLWPEYRSYDDDCSGSASGVGSFAQGADRIHPGDCFLIRVGGFSGDQGVGYLTIECIADICSAASPAELITQPTEGGSPVPIVRNRVLGLTAGDPGRTQAIRITFSALPPPWHVWNGVELWVTQPDYVCYVSGIGPNEICPADVGGFWFAGLTCDAKEAFKTDWTEVGPFYVIHPGIVPMGEYVVQMLDDTCDSGRELDYSEPLIVRNSIWGDISGEFDPNAEHWVPPDGRADVFPDVVAALAAFSNRPGNLTKMRADVEPCVLDLKVNIPDILFLLDAFRGLAFPFTPGVGDCPGDPCDGAASVGGVTP